MAALRYPLHATAPATWYRDTMAVPGMFLSVSDPKRWAGYERSVSGYNGWKPGRSPVRHGVDRHGIGHSTRFGVNGWDDIDNPYGEVIQYLRSPDHPRGPLEAAKVFTRSAIDAKLMHRPGSHVYQCNYGAWQFEHFGIQGWLICYCLTGEAYALEGARELAEGLRIRIPGWSQRAQGGAIKAFVSLFEITQEEGYLDSAMDIVRRHRGGQGVRGDVWSLHAFVWQLAFIANATGRYCLAARLAGRQDRTARMLRLDLADAGIPYRDAAGRVADFHALRHTFISSLAAGGVHPKVAQTLARHSDIRLTLDRYAHVLSEQQIEAIDRLPDLSVRPSEGRRGLM